MTPFVSPTKKAKEAPLFSASFFIWRYDFYADRIEIFRNFILTRTTVIYIDKIEMLMTETDPILSHFGRCNLVLTFAGNVFTLFGLPKAALERFSQRFAQSEPTNRTSIRIPTRDLLKKSAMQTKWVWYILLNVVIWAAILLMGSDFIDSDKAHAMSEFVFRHMLVAGTLVLSLGLPTALIWLWALTGGFLTEFLQYYHYTATRQGNLLYFEYGLLIHRQVYIDITRIAIVEFRQSPLMRLFGYGELKVRAVGHNPVFFRSQPILPFIRAKYLPDDLALLFPALEQKTSATCKRSLFYDFISWKSTIPFLLASFSLFLGWGWLIVALVAALLVVSSILLEYQNTDFAALPNASPDSLVLLSCGGFYRTAAWINASRIEMIAVSGSRRKLRKGYLNIRVRVFGKSGTYALIRNVEASTVEAFKGLERK